ncbi:glycosyltransferase family 4 protein [soil metagenome]
MKIAFCLHHFLPQTVAGTEVYVLNLSRELKKQGTEVVVIIPNLGSNETNEYFYEEIKVIRYAENSVESRQMILGQQMPDGLPLFIHILEKETPSIVHFHELAPGRAFNINHLVAAKERGFRVFMTFHMPHLTCTTGSLFYKAAFACDGMIRRDKCTSCAYHSRGITSNLFNTVLTKTAGLLYGMGIDTSKMNNGPGTALAYPFLIDQLKKNLRLLSDSCDKIIVLAHWYRKILEINEVPESKLIYIQQGLPEGGGSINSSKNNDGRLKIIFVGRISEFKGVHLLIEAFTQIAPENISLDIYGPETDENYVTRCKNMADGMENIQWKGMLASDNRVDTLAGYDILCLPSTFSEMSPLVIQEAYEAGIPVLASNVYGNKEQIADNENGWLFRFKDSNDLASKLKYLVENPSVVVKAKSCLPMPSRFDGIASAHLNVYNNLERN